MHYASLWGPLSLTDELVKSDPPPPYVYTQQPQVVVRQQVLDNPPSDQFVMSLFTTFCCFMPLGIIALIKSIEVSTGIVTIIALVQLQAYSFPEFCIRFA